jgi:hypothetical protein
MLSRSPESVVLSLHHAHPTPLAFLFYCLSDPFSLTGFSLHFQGLDGTKGEKGASGERGPHGLPVSVMSHFFPQRYLIL